MIKLGRYTGILMMIAIIFSCTEKNEPTPFDYTKVISGEESKTWHLQSISFTNEGDPDWKLSDDCWEDDEYTFFRNDVRTFEFRTGSRKCDPSEDSFTLTDTWSFSNASATLYMVIPILADIPLPYTVVNVDRNDLELQIYFDEAGTQSYLMKFESDDF